MCSHVRVAVVRCGVLVPGWFNHRQADASRLESCPGCPDMRALLAGVQLAIWQQRLHGYHCQHCQPLTCQCPICSAHPCRCCFVVGIASVLLQPQMTHHLDSTRTTTNRIAVLVPCSERAQLIEEELQAIAHFVAAQHAGRYRKERNRWVHVNRALHGQSAVVAKTSIGCVARARTSYCRSNTMQANDNMRICKPRLCGDAASS